MLFLLSFGPFFLGLLLRLLFTNPYIRQVPSGFGVCQQILWLCCTEMGSSHGTAWVLRYPETKGLCEMYDFSLQCRSVSNREDRQNLTSLSELHPLGYKAAGQTLSTPCLLFSVHKWDRNLGGMELGKEDEMGGRDDWCFTWAP